MLRTILASLTLLALITGCRPEAACIARTEAFVATNRAWSGGVVPLCWEDLAASSAADRALVTTMLAQQITRHAAVRFEDRGGCTADTFPGIRIGVADLPPQAVGLGSEIMGIGNGIRLNFTFGDWGHDCAANEGVRRACIQSIALHEFLHAVGFAHEQNRHDAPVACAPMHQGESGNDEVGAFDAESVVNYCNDHWNNDGKVSSGDVAGLQELYGKPEAPNRRDDARASSCHA